MKTQPQNVCRKAIGAFVTLVAIVAAVSAVQAEGIVRTLDDRHLSAKPRTTSQIADVTERTTLSRIAAMPQASERKPGGAGTVALRSDPHAFSQVSANVRPDKELDFIVGSALFRRVWVPAPSDDVASDGVGPLFNARSCEQCHIKDGRGHPPQAGQTETNSLVLRVALPGEATYIASEIEGYLATRPDPIYGNQIQDGAVGGVTAEALLEVNYTEEKLLLSEGETVSLRRPEYKAAGLAYGDLHPEARLSPRVAPQIIGLGLLEAVPAADILKLADPEDKDGDGISGRANIVWSRVHKSPMLGRFGLKAGVATLLEQTASAFAADMGISNEIFPDGWGDCTVHQPQCRDALHGDGDARTHEIDAIGLELVTFYSRNLAVPARRGVDDPQVLLGRDVFYETGCAACHRPSFVTHTLIDQPEQSFQHIWPYTDMLLHDMGDGLADDSPEGRATGREWRTPPLWGIGLTKQVTGQASFLHDGRARSMLEAILWHGGEAASQRDAVQTMPKADRDALIAFLQSL